MTEGGGCKSTLGTYSIYSIGINQAHQICKVLQFKFHVVTCGQHLIVTVKNKNL